MTLNECVQGEVYWGDHIALSAALVHASTQCFLTREEAVTALGNKATIGRIRIVEKHSFLYVQLNHCGWTQGRQVTNEVWEQ